MFRQTTEDEYEERCEGGSRHLFFLDSFEFHDALDAEERMHHFVVEAGAADRERVVYEVGQPLMYELMARYLAGEYEKREYDLDRSPAHEALLDLLELAAAKARSGETDFSLESLEEGDSTDGFEEEDETA